MTAREIVVLGTAAQVPTRDRAHNAVLLLWDEVGVLFDPGEGTQRQLTLAGIPVSRVDQVCITHFHGDHCLGLPGIVQRMALDRREAPVGVAYPAAGEEYYQRLRHASVFDDHAVTVPAPIEVRGPVAQVGELTVIAEPLDHRVATFGYRLEEPGGWRMLPERLTALGVSGPEVGRLQQGEAIEVRGRWIDPDEVRVPRPGQSVAVVLDTRPCRGAVDLARDVDLLVCEATFLESEVALAQLSGHLTARQAGELAAEAGARQLVLTHFSQRYKDTDQFVAEAGEVFGNVVVAEDLARIPVPPRIE
ncbi:MAG: ribonuclease Z [Acidimicrobiales bacterium]